LTGNRPGYLERAFELAKVEASQLIDRLQEKTGRGS